MLGTLTWLFALPWIPLVAAIGIGWLLAVVTMLDWHVGMLERPDGRPLGGLGVPNLLSLARLATIPLLLALPSAGIGAAVVLAAMTDVVDGVLARSRDQVTRLGRWLDGAADATLLVSAVVILATRDVVSLWVAGLVIARHALQWAGVAASYFIRCAPPRLADIASARAAGAVIVAGIATAPYASAAGTTLILLGATAGLAATAITTRRTLVSDAKS